MKAKYFALIAGFVFLISCDVYIRERGNGVIETQSWDVDNFTQVELTGHYEVEFQKGDQPKVVIETDENLFDFIEVRDRGKILEIASRDRIKSSDGIKVYITYTDLNGIFAGGAVEIRAYEVIRTDYLELDMSGAGLIDLEILADELSIDISGAGAVRLSGEVKDLEVQMSGAGDLKAYDMMTQYCKISISGVGSADVFVTDELDASVSGLGGVSYIGNPPRVDSDVSGLGRISEGRNRDNL